MVTTSTKDEKLKKKPPQGGARRGAGRKTGGKNQKTIEKKIVFEEMRQTVLKHARPLLEAQMSLAKGVSLMYRIEVTGKGTRRKTKHILITDPKEISEALDEMNGGGSGTINEQYHYITTERPENKALDSLFDRIFGKAASSVDLTSGGKTIKTNQIIFGNMGKDETVGE